MAAITGPIVTNFIIPPLTQKETEVQARIDALNALSPERIERIYGDSKHQSFWTTTLGGDLETARSYYRNGFDRPLYSSQAANLALCVLYTIAALPAKVLLTLAHTFSCENQISDLRSRDFQDLGDAAHFIVTGTLYGLSNAVAALLADPILLLASCCQPETAAIIFVDIQNDFMPPKANFPGGALPVTDGWDIIPVINSLTRVFNGRVVFGCADSHPVDHRATGKMLNVGPYTSTSMLCSPQMSWTVHGVEGSRGQQYAYGLDVSKVRRVFLKGQNRNVDSYSGVYDNGHQFKTAMAPTLKMHNVKKVYVVGLASDYCVGFTALDLQAEGFETVVVGDATKPVAQESNARMMQQLAAKHIRVINSAELLNTDPYFRQNPPVLNT